jgi:hypothetical protein
MEVIYKTDKAADGILGHRLHPSLLWPSFRETHGLNYVYHYVDRTCNAYNLFDKRVP